MKKTIQVEIALHRAGEAPADFGLAPEPVILATLELDAAA
jgi:hypothetical protein